MQNNWTRSRWFVGINNDHSIAVIFKAHELPQEEKYGSMFGFVYGPHTTKQEAINAGTRQAPGYKQFIQCNKPDFVCPFCGAHNFYCYWDSNVNEGRYHCSEGSCFEATCGKCKVTFSPANSPINAPCYTHSED
jgi:hypothetical protein